MKSLREILSTMFILSFIALPVFAAEILWLPKGNAQANLKARTQNLPLEDFERVSIRVEKASHVFSLGRDRYTEYQALGSPAVA